MPVWVSDALPRGVDELANTLIDWLREHAQMARSWAPKCCALAHILIGFVISAKPWSPLSANHLQSLAFCRPLATDAWCERCPQALQLAFSAVHLRPGLQSLS
ncbi:hypothetical protein ACU4GD_24800 [Cupriavidus basilensis]